MTTLKNLVMTVFGLCLVLASLPYGLWITRQGGNK